MPLMPRLLWWQWKMQAAEEEASSVGRLLAVAALIVVLLPVLCATAHAQNPSFITGTCDCDSVLKRTTCNYTVFSGQPALNRFLFPVPAELAGRCTASSPFYTFVGPQVCSDLLCGELHGFMANQELPSGQATTFTITYDDLCSLGVSMVYAGLSGVPECDLLAVETVVGVAYVPCVEWTIDATKFDFYLRKSGTVAGMLATMTISSNADVTVRFQSFDNLVGETAEAGVIPAWYAATSPEQTVPPEQFLTPSDFNQQSLIIPGDEIQHQFSLWSKIMTDRDTQACDYNDNATIQLILENHNVWIDGPE